MENNKCEITIACGDRITADIYFTNINNEALDAYVSSKEVDINTINNDINITIDKEARVFPFITFYKDHKYHVDPKFGTEITIFGSREILTRYLHLLMEFNSHMIYKKEIQVHDDIGSISIFIPNNIDILGRIVFIYDD